MTRATTWAIALLTVVQLGVGAFSGLQQYDGKGFGYRLILYPVMMAIPLIWWWWTHRGARVPWGAIALVWAPFFTDVTGNTLDLFDAVVWWDDATHFVNWALLCGGLGLLMVPELKPRWLQVLVVTGLGALLAIGWELGEWWTFIRRGVELDTAYEDTLGDEALGTLGALVAGLTLGSRRLTNRSRREGNPPMTLYLVRHGRPIIDPDRPAAQWDLDPLFFDDVWALRESSRLPSRASWFCSPEPKAQQTAQLLTDGEVGVVDELREHERGAGWVGDFSTVVKRAFADPDVAALTHWEPLSQCRDRLVPAVRRILDAHAGENVVLVGHGTAWTVVVAALTAEPFDLDAWSALAMPDVIELPA